MRETLEDKVQYRTDVEQRSRFIRNLVIGIVIGAVILAGIFFRDQLATVISNLITNIKGIALAG